MEPAPVIVGLPWYTEASYPQARDTMDDASQMPDGFADWLLEAQGVEARLVQQGVTVVHAELDPWRFTVWCRLRKLRCDAAARRQFAYDQACEAHPRGATVLLW
jgi:hypothetical protein